MQPQGTALINQEFFTQQQAQMSNCASCAELQLQVDAAFASIQAGKNAITDQIALLAPLLALLIAPSANPAAIVTWLESFITKFLTPFLVPYTNYSIQLADLLVQVTDLIAAVNAAKANIPGCSVTIPPIV